MCTNRGLCVPTYQYGRTTVTIENIPQTRPPIGGQKWPLYCPQGSGTLRQQLLMMHGIALYCMVMHGIALYCMVLHGIALHCIVLHCIAWYCMVLHGIAWYCMVLHRIA